MAPTGTCTQNDNRNEMGKSCETFAHETLIVDLIRGDSGREIDNRLRTASFGRAPYKYRLLTFLSWQMADPHLRVGLGLAS